MILFMRWIHRCSSPFYAIHLVYDCLLVFFPSNKLWCIDFVHVVKKHFRRFEILRCVLIPVTSCDMNLIWYLLLIGVRWKAIWTSLFVMIFRFPFFNDCIARGSFFWTVLIHSYVMICLNRMRRHIRSLIIRTVLHQWLRWAQINLK